MLTRQSDLHANRLTKIKNKIKKAITTIKLFPSPLFHTQLWTFFWLLRCNIEIFGPTQLIKLYGERRIKKDK